jgi:hypothetical protein
VGLLRRRGEASPLFGVKAFFVRGKQYGKRYGKVESRAFFFYVGGRQAHQYAFIGELKPAVANRRPHSLARLSHGAVGKPHHVDGGNSSAQIDFYGNKRALIAKGGKAVNLHTLYIAFILRFWTVLLENSAKIR